MRRRGGVMRDGTREAMFYEDIGNDRVRCGLCPHRCTLGPGKTGVCGVRRNMDGKLHTLVYGMTSAANTDPIEKKPLFHFHPGSRVMSLATVGCNMSCSQCQNWTLSQVRDGTARGLRHLGPERPTELARRDGAAGIAWTYNEPTVWFEYTLDASRIAREAGLYVVYVTNGYIEKEPLETIAPYLQAMNVDVKAFTREFYGSIAGARLEPVLDTVKRARDLGIHVELTYLIIPTLNDSMEEITSFIDWVLENAGPEVPIHLSRFHPDHRLTHLPPTSVETMKKAHEKAVGMGMEYIYLGNVPGLGREDTSCPSCGALLVGRKYYSIDLSGLKKGGRCARCGRAVPIIM